ncbi:MAG: hypothetical protein E3J86_14205 [Candidatus Thorarchaeota archaeon]|nr:MAG: hypothetical protein E3J86_14205 [Candidatus Thorarchaeota archaeon]
MILAICSFLTIMILAQGIPVNAHAPQGTLIGYNFIDDELSVTFSHSVDDVNTHYIHQVIVELNSVVVLTRDYTSQNSTEEFSAIYHIVADHGDFFLVTAKCVLSGEATQELDLTWNNPNETPFDPTLMIASVIVAFSAIAAIVVFMKRR